MACRLKPKTFAKSCEESKGKFGSSIATEVCSRQRVASSELHRGRRTAVSLPLLFSVQIFSRLSRLTRRSAGCEEVVRNESKQGEQRGTRSRLDANRAARRGGLQSAVGGRCDCRAGMAVPVGWDGTATLPADLAVCGDDRRRLRRWVLDRLHRPPSSLADRVRGTTWKNSRTARFRRGRTLG